MTAPDYVHLHLHTHYSVLDGVCQIPPLMARAKELAFRSLAITDHGVMYGAIDFYLAAEKAGIKPILGFEAYVAPGSRFEREAHGIKDAAYHLVLLAKNYKGYLNLSKLCTAGFLEGFYYRPRVDKELLREHAEGVIALSGCLSGEVSRHTLHDRLDEAEAAARAYREIFGEENFFLEIQDNGLPEQRKIIEPMAALSKKTGIPLVATSDVHYILPEHADVQDMMICINTAKQLDDPNRMKMDSDQFFLRSAEQMRLVFKGYEHACDQTLAIAERCNVELPLSRNFTNPEEKFHLPVIVPPQGGTPEEYLHELCMKGLVERYGDPLAPDVLARYEKEKRIIIQMGFPSYFLMVWEIVNFARTNGIPVGPGRGSAAGSIIAYALRITDLDPLKYSLLFERFLNEGRNEMPDIDLDFDKERRQEVVDFIVNHYGRDQCAQIITFGKISAKSAVRDVGRVLAVPLNEVDVIAKMIPDMLKPKGGKTTIEIAMAENPDLAQIYKGDAGVRRLLDFAGHLDGVIRQTGIHAAGVLVADKPLATTYGPLAKRGDDITFQYDMKKVEELGLCKVDVLGLETLTLLRKAVDIVRESTGVEVDLSNLPMKDADTFAMLTRGDAKGVFQFESEGFRELLVKLRPDRFEDLIAAVAMYRPGPLGCGMVDDYINCKHGRQDPAYIHPMIEPILCETFGLILYQEQVQALAAELAHFNLSEGDLMRRAMGKKIQAIMDEYKEKFVRQAHDTIGEENAAKVFEQIEYFAGYGFNKSHSACYALIAYQTAYLKAHYPKEYMAALMTTNRGDAKKIVEYKADAEKMGIRVLAPDVNESGAYFRVIDGDIRFGLSAIKGVGDRAVEGIEAERTANGRFRSLFDFCERVDMHLIKKNTMEALIKAGAFDGFGGHRAQYVAALESALAAGSSAQKARSTGQNSLFGMIEDAIEEPPLPQVPAWDDQMMLQFEKDVLGFYISSHPLARFDDKLRAFANATTARLPEMDHECSVTIGGQLSAVNLRMDKKNRRYAQLVVEDMEGSVRVMVFSSIYEDVKEFLIPDSIVFVLGKLDRSQKDPSILADRIIPMEKAEAELSKFAIISVEAAGLQEAWLDPLRDLVKAHRGEVPLFFNVKAHNRKHVLIRAGGAYRVRPTEHLTKDIEALMGEGHIRYTARANG